MKLTAPIAFVIAMTGLAPIASAQPFEIDWWTIDAGGGTITGDAYELSGTIGQHDASVPLFGGIFTLEPGFWPGVFSTPPCQADLNGDGILDNGDIAEFLTLFLAGDLAVDFNGDGLLDNGDISGFLIAFLAGCP